MTSLIKSPTPVTMLRQKLGRGQSVRIKKTTKPEAVTVKTNATEMTSVVVETATDVVVTAIATATVDVTGGAAVALPCKTWTGAAAALDDAADWLKDLSSLASHVSAAAAAAADEVCVPASVPWAGRTARGEAVSYTHLTLPTTATV